MTRAPIRLWGSKAEQLYPLDGGPTITPPPPIDPPPIDPPPVDPPPPGSLWLPGLSRSTGGLNDSPANKQADTLARVAQFAAQAGISATAMRAQTIYHGYISGNNWDPSGIGPLMFAVNNGFRGHCQNQGIPDYATWAAGGYDANYRAFLVKQSALSAAHPAFGGYFINIYQHEPENDPNAIAEAPDWCQGQARFAKITAEHNDPKIIYSTCHIPNAAGKDRTLWNLRPALNALAGGVAAGQAIMNRTLCGLDPYPEMGNDGTTLQTLADRITAPMNYYKSVGFSKFFFPEVAFFNYKVNGSGPGSLTAAQQAKRLHDELWTYARAKGVVGFMYFDVTDVSNPRGDSRTLATAEEQLEYSKILRQIA